jgi:hypothetical protein
MDNEKLLSYIDSLLELTQQGIKVCEKKEDDYSKGRLETLK